jgi:hypothetical protein
VTSCKWKQSNSKGKRLLSTFILYIYTIQSSLGITGFAQRRKYSLFVNVFEGNDGTVEVMFKTSNLPKKRRHACQYTSTYACITAEIPSGTLPIMGRVAQSVQRLVTGWKVRGSNPVGGEIFRTCPDRWGPPSLLYNGYRVFPGGKERPGRKADPSPPSSAVVMKGKSYTSTPPMGRSVCTESVPVQGCNLPLHYTRSATDFP